MRCPCSPFSPPPHPLCASMVHKFQILVSLFSASTLWSTAWSAETSGPPWSTSSEAKGNRPQPVSIRPRKGRKWPETETRCRSLTRRRVGKNIEFIEWPLWLLSFKLTKTTYYVYIMNVICIESCSSILSSLRQLNCFKVNNTCIIVNCIIVRRMWMYFFNDIQIFKPLKFHVIP